MAIVPSRTTSPDLNHGKSRLEQPSIRLLGLSDPKLCQMFYGTVACDHLPAVINQEGPTAYIVNTDPHDQPGKHWVALWTHYNVCELLDSYALPLEQYKTTDPLIEWLHRHYKYQVHSDQLIQSVFSQSCGDYDLMFLVLKARGPSMQDFLSLFSSHDFVSNDRKVRGWLRACVVNQLAWQQ